MKSIAIAGLFAVALLSAFLFAEDADKAKQVPATAPTTQQAPVNKKCPITGEDVDPRMTFVYDGKVYAFCCKPCIQQFKKDPDKYKNAK